MNGKLNVHADDLARCQIINSEGLIPTLNNIICFQIWSLGKKTKQKSDDYTGGGGGGGAHLPIRKKKRKR